jgi:uncharacterized phage protein gp47/JayE
MSPLPTFSQIVQSMVTFLQGKRPDIASNTGTVVNDVVISTVADQLVAQNGTSQSVYSSILYTQELQAFVDNASLLVDSDLDAIGANYGMIRNPGTLATGTIIFRIRNYTVTSPIITVPAGTTVSTLATTSSPAVSFATTAGVTFSPSFAPSYFNPATGFYEQPATIIAQIIGVIGNVAAQTITSLVSSVPGIDAITNDTATTGGTDKESNQAFASRIQIKLEGNNVGTPNGIISLVNTNPSVQQAIVVGPNDPEMQRDQFGGSVDVYIKGQILTTVSDTFMYSTAGSQSFVLTHQPVVSMGLVTGVVLGVSGHVFIPVTDYVIHINPNALFAGSTEATSYIQWTLGGTKPDNDTNFTISYTYDSLIESLQALFNNDSDHIVTSDILVREAEEAFIGVNETIIVLPGYVAATVQANVQTALSNYINGLGLGAIIDLSDIVVVSELVPGVDQVNLSTLSISSTVGIVITTIPPGQRLTIGKTAYTVPGTLVINI